MCRRQEVTAAEQHLITLVYFNHLHTVEVSLYDCGCFSGTAFSTQIREC